MLISFNQFAKISFLILLISSKDNTIILKKCEIKNNNNNNKIKRNFYRLFSTIIKLS